MGEALHPRRMKILRYLAGRASVEGPPPSVREIGAAVGLSSSQTVHHHLGRLEEGGYVIRVGRGARTLGLTGKGWEAAGLLSVRSGRRRYLLRVVGQSMVGARIEDGDLLVVEEGEIPPDGAVVVALLSDGDEVTVKRLYREGAKVRLRPENGEHKEILVPADEVRVQGRVVYVVHPPRRGPSGDGS